MGTSSRSLAVRFLMVGSITPLFVASFLPIWTVWYENPVEGLGVRRSLWGVLWEVARSPLETPNPAFPVTTTGDPHDLVVAGALFYGGGFAGAVAFVVWRLLLRRHVRNG